MDFDYPGLSAPKPFVPFSIEFPKNKARKLQKLIGGVRLSSAQQTVAKALGWKDWYALESAIAQRASPSKHDDDVDYVERSRRFDAQVEAVRRGLGLDLPDPEDIVLELGLTRSGVTAHKGSGGIGPWGAFSKEPEEIAPGILFGFCTRFWCFWLTEERQAQVRAQWRIESDGWYMAADHGWRVILSMPDLFDVVSRASAERDMVKRYPSLLEMIAAGDQQSLGYASIRERATAARAHPDAWFIIAVLEDMVPHRPKLRIVKAVRGRHLLFLIESSEIRPSSGAVEVGWFVVPVRDARLGTEPAFPAETVPRYASPY